MLKKISSYLTNCPALYSFLRRIIECNFLTIKRTIRKELQPAETNAAGVPRSLDIPCGIGELCSLFPPETYTGADISPLYIEYARNRFPHNTFYCRDARDTGFTSAHFDRIFMFGLLHHLDDTVLDTIIAEMKRILSVTGIMLLIEDAPVTAVWNIIGKWLQQFDEGDAIRPPQVYRKLVEKYFTIQKEYPLSSGFWHYTVFVLTPKS